MPSAKLDDLASFRVVMPRPTPTRAKTRHAIGIENRSCISMIGACGDSPAARMRSASRRRAGSRSSARPRWGALCGNIDSMPMLMRMSLNSCSS